MALVLNHLTAAPLSCQEPMNERENMRENEPVNEPANERENEPVNEREILNC